MHTPNQRWIGAVAIAVLGIATAWLQPDYAITIMAIGSLFILFTITFD